MSHPNPPFLVEGVNDPSEDPPTERVSRMVRSSVSASIATRELPTEIAAHTAASHPLRDLTRQTRPDLDVEDLTTGTSLPAIDVNALSVERMPGIRDHSKLRSVC